MWNFDRVHLKSLTQIKLFDYIRNPLLDEIYVSSCILNFGGVYMQKKNNP